MGFYDIDYQNVVYNLIPQTRRKTRFISWMRSLLSPQEYTSDIFFGEYVNGSDAPDWSPFVALYPKGTKVNFFNSIYMATQNVPSGHLPTDTNYWVLIVKDYRGVNQRVRYNSQKICLEYILNDWFNGVWLQPDSPTSPTRPDIYIDTNLPTNQVLTSYYTENAESNIYYYDALTYSYVMDNYSFNSPSFSIYVPIALYTGLGANADEQIRAIADKYVIAGITYDIQTY